MSDAFEVLAWEVVERVGEICRIECGSIAWREPAASIQLRAGDQAALQFRLRGEDEHGTFFEHESLWVTVRSVTATGYEGVVLEGPRRGSSPRAGEVVCFGTASPSAIRLPAPADFDEEQWEGRHVGEEFPQVVRRTMRERRRWTSPRHAGPGVGANEMSPWEERLRGWWLWRVAPWVALGAFGAVVALTMWREWTSPRGQAPVTGVLITALFALVLRSLSSPSSGGWFSRWRAGWRGETNVAWVWPELMRDRRTAEGMWDFDWSKFSEVAQWPDGLMFYQGELVFCYLPRNRFESEEDYERVVEMARQRIVIFRQRR